MLAVPLQTLHQHRRFSESAALNHVHPNAKSHRLAKAAETGLAHKTGATAEHIEGPNPVGQNREIGELSQLRLFRGDG